MAHASSFSAIEQLHSLFSIICVLDAVDEITNVCAQQRPVGRIPQPSAFYSLRLQSHDPSTFFIETNDVVFQSRFVMFYPIYPRLAISRLLNCFYDLLVLSLWVEVFCAQGRDLRRVVYEFTKFVFRMPLLALVHVSRA